MAPRAAARATATAIIAWLTSSPTARATASTRSITRPPVPHPTSKAASPARRPNAWSRDRRLSRNSAAPRGRPGTGRKLHGDTDEDGGHEHDDKHGRAETRAQHLARGPPEPSPTAGSSGRAAPALCDTNGLGSSVEVAFR